MKTNTKSTKVNLLDTYNQFGLNEEHWLEYLESVVDKDQYIAWIKNHNFTEEELSFEKYCTEVCYMQDYDDWLSDMSATYSDDFWSNATGAFDARQKGFVVTGTLGLWNGRPQVGNICLSENIFDTIRTCFGDDIDDLQIDFEDGVIWVNAMHHDGTNSFAVRALSAKGIQWAERHPNFTLEDCQFLADTKGYTKKIKIF